MTRPRYLNYILRRPWTEHTEERTEHGSSRLLDVVTHSKGLSSQEIGALVLIGNRDQLGDFGRHVSRSCDPHISWICYRLELGARCTCGCRRSLEHRVFALVFRLSSLIRCSFGV